MQRDLKICMLKLLDILHLHMYITVMSSRSFYVISVIDTQYFCVCMLYNLLNKCACIINHIEISILFFNIDLFKDRVLFVRMYKMTGYYLSACANRRGTICPHVQK